MRLILMLLGPLFVALTAAQDEYHPKKAFSEKIQSFSFGSEKEVSSEFWKVKGQAMLEELLSRKDNTKHAKNVIMFLGDGMSFPTVAATRAYMGGEEEELSFEKFPYTGFSKTFCVDSQVADSACTSTAYLSGVKTNYQVIGLNAQAAPHSCDSQLEEGKLTESIARWAQKSCKATGIVTNTRITHASPAGAYAHVAHRDWENDFELKADGCDPNKHRDIAEQLVHNTTGKHFKVILGGGRAGFRDSSLTDEEGFKGYRQDKRDLIKEWQEERSKSGKAAYVFDRSGLRNIDYANTDYLLGLFEGDHMKYHLDVMNQNLQYKEPSLTDMTVAAIRMLQKEEQGFFLFVEGGMIDQAHHYNYAQAALDETKEFSKAIEAARQMTDESDTLIVVTADHAHVFTYNGYPDRGNPILGNAEISDEDFMPFTTLSYANGPGFAKTYGADGKRVNPDTFDFTDPKMQYPATVPLTKETHGGEDVGVWASGPMAHLFRGSYDQTAIPLIMAHILQVGPYAIDERCSSCSLVPLLFLLTAMLLILKFVK